MPDFSAKMHQIQFRLGLGTQTPLGELTAPPPDPKLVVRGLSAPPQEPHPTLVP